MGQRQKPSTGAAWSVVVPVKRLPLAKTRLQLPAAMRAELALAMACDTVRAALEARGVAEVVVVTDDPEAAAAAAALGARVIGDRPGAGLNPALRHGIDSARQRSVALLSSDLPATTGDEVDRVLAAAPAGGSGAVADAAGTGTTMLVLPRSATFVPRFGDGSFAAHLRDGAVDLTAVAGPGLRHDVDTLAGLEAVLVLGAGPETSRVGRLVTGLA